MDHHTFPASEADRLEDAAFRYRYLSAEELVWALAPDGDETVVDLGSGTGFFTDDVAPHVGTVYAVDVQDAMHDRYREKGVPGNVSLVTSDTADLPFDDGALGGAFSTMTFHELPRTTVAETARVLDAGARFVVADWSADGPGEDGPPVAERVNPDDAAETLREAGFDVAFEAVRPETFLLVGRKS